MVTLNNYFLYDRHIVYGKDWDIHIEGPDPVLEEIHLVRGRTEVQAYFSLCIATMSHHLKGIMSDITCKLPKLLKALPEIEVLGAKMKRCLGGDLVFTHSDCKHIPKMLYGCSHPEFKCPFKMVDILDWPK